MADLTDNACAVHAKVVTADHHHPKAPRTLLLRHPLRQRNKQRALSPPLMRRVFYFLNAEKQRRREAELFICLRRFRGEMRGDREGRLGRIIYIFIFVIGAHLAFCHSPAPRTYPKNSLRPCLSAFSALKTTPQHLLFMLHARQVDRQHGDVRGIDSRNARCLRECLRPHLCQPLAAFIAQGGDGEVVKIVRNAR